MRFSQWLFMRPLGPLRVYLALTPAAVLRSTSTSSVKGQCFLHFKIVCVYQKWKYEYSIGLKSPDIPNNTTLSREFQKFGDNGDNVDDEMGKSWSHIGAQLDFLQNLCKFWWIHLIFTNFGDIFVEFFVDSLKFSLFLVIDFSPILPLFFSQYMFTNFGDFFLEFFGES